MQAFCRKAKIDSMKPRYLCTGDPVVIPGTGELVESASVADYRLGIIADNSLLRLYTKESLYLIMLVRERIQREKMLQEAEPDEEED